MIFYPWEKRRGGMKWFCFLGSLHNLYEANRGKNAWHIVSVQSVEYRKPFTSGWNGESKAIANSVIGGERKTVDGRELGV